MRHSSRILVVDDNATNLEIFHEILDEDFVVQTARDGSEALRIAKKTPPNVVLLDVMLPGIDGYETCRRLRSLPSMQGARIIMVSAKAMPSELADGFSAGADEYVTKPFDEADLIAAIRPYDEPLPGS